MFQNWAKKLAQVVAPSSESMCQLLRPSHARTQTRSTHAVSWRLVNLQTSLCPHSIVVLRVKARFLSGIGTRSRTV